MNALADMIGGLDDPYEGVVEYDYLMAMQELAIAEAIMEKELAEDYEADKLRSDSAA